MTKTKKLRSQHWFGPDDFHGFLHRGWMKNQGWPQDMFEGKPVGAHPLQRSLPRTGGMG
jgi:L-arabonate dehydrase